MCKGINVRAWNSSFFCILEKKKETIEFGLQMQRQNALQYRVSEFSK